MTRTSDANCSRTLQACRGGRTTPSRSQTMATHSAKVFIPMDQAANANQTSEQLFDIAGNRIGLRHRAKPGDHVAFLVDQELREVPLDAFGPQHARRFLGQVTEQRM